MCYYSNTLDMFFQKKHRKTVGVIGGVLCIFIIVSMILLYFPILYR